MDHSVWRMLVIIGALVFFVLTCIINGLSATGPSKYGDKDSLKTD